MECDDFTPSTAILLELAAADDLPAFRRTAELVGSLLHAPAPWYGPRSDTGKGGAVIGYEMRTPLQVAAMYGSLGVMCHILSKSSVEDVNRPCGADGATALHCAAAGGAARSRQAVLLLLNAFADAGALDAAGRRPVDLVRRRIRIHRAAVAELELLLDHHAATVDDKEDGASWSSSSSPATPPSPPQRKEYPPDATLPDIASGLYSTDEFRMYVYKVAPCPRAYSHDWTECPFAHPGENARRRDPRRQPYYSPAPCPDFRRAAAAAGAAAATCPRGDACEFAHGVFESWLHPAQYRTRMCKDEGACTRKVCFFAHSQEELRQPAESLDFGVISANLMMGLTQPQQQPIQLNSAVAVAGINDLDKLGFSPSPIAKHQQQYLPSLYRISVRSTPSSPRTPRSPALTMDQSSHSTAVHGRSRAAAAASFAANRSQSFAADRGSCGCAAAQQTRLYFAAPNLSGWGSADGKLDWGIKGDDLTKLRKTAPFGADRGQQNQLLVEPDVSWVQSVVGDQDDLDVGGGGLLRLNSSGRSAWSTDPLLYPEQEQLVA